MQSSNPSASNSSYELSLNSRDEAEHTRCKKVTKKNKTKKRTRKLTNADLKEIPDDMLEESRQRIDSSIPCKFDQIVYMDNVKGKTYSFRYLAYKFDWESSHETTKMKNPCYVHALEVDSIISSVHGTILR